MIRGGRRVTIECHAVVALLCHPREGWLLFDTGYAPRLLDATVRWPMRIYRWGTPLRLRPELAAVAQLPRFGLRAGDVRHVVLSHFHPDHLAGLLDFPEATVVCSEAGFRDVVSRRGFSALRRAFVPDLLPRDLESRARFVTNFASESCGALGPTLDLFGDGSLRLVDLPGHARGQFGLLARTDRGTLLFTADGCYLREAVRTNRPPHAITHLIVDDPRVACETLTKLHEFWKANPHVEFVPSHCPEAFRMFVEPVA